jgi:hypothetical protein
LLRRAAQDLEGLGSLQDAGEPVMQQTKRRHANILLPRLLFHSRSPFTPSVTLLVFVRPTLQDQGILDQDYDIYFGECDPAIETASAARLTAVNAVGSQSTTPPFSTLGLTRRWHH